MVPSLSGAVWVQPARFASGRPEAEVAAHVETCPACAEVVEAIRSTTSPTPTVPVRFTPLPGAGPIPGQVISRYVVLRRLGRGGMGVVVLAYDPVLDRTVAVKLMRTDLASPELAARLEREARSLARLSHPNVVRVFDAGTWEGRVFMAMEHVEGETLHDWLAAAPRATADILRVFTDAGHGLVATHDAGFVHRDVKPSNILLGADQVARLADFGLVGGEAASEPSSDAPRAAAAMLVPETTATTPLTRPDVAMGTPGYMAPEQRVGAALAPAADQYAFCASLWEALFGARPLPDQPATPEPAGERHVAPWLREVLVRGLRAAPEARWPSMRALLDALGNDPAVARRRRLTRAGAVLGLVALGGLAAFGLARRPAPAAARCRGLDAALAGVWDPARAARVEAAFRATGRASAAGTYARVATQLDGYARAWVGARVETCKATHERGEQSEAVLDVRMACLDGRRRELGALVDVLAAQLDAAGLDKAVVAVTRLAPIDACADVTTLQVIVPPPAGAGVRAEIDRVRVALASAKALEDTGQYARGLALAQEASRSAERLRYAPLLAEALYRRGSLEDHGGDSAAAEASLEAAVVAAGAAHDDELAAQIWADLVYIVGGPLGRPADARRLRVGAEAAMRRAGADPLLEAKLWVAVAMTAYAGGDLVEARRAQELALELVTAARGPDHPDLAPVLTTLGNILYIQAAHAEARACHERALVIFEQALGSEHPHVAASLTNLGLVLQAEGRLAEARQMHERALVVQERALGPEHPAVAATLTNLGLVVQELGDHAEARRLHERALGLREKALGPDHPDVAVSLSNLGGVAQAMGDLAGARRYHERALAVREKALGPDHADVGVSQHNLGDAAAGLGEHRLALAHYERALAIWRAALGPDHPHLAYALAGRARERLALGDAAGARADAERAVEIRQAAGGGTPHELATTRFLLARALWSRAAERPRALALARDAAGALATLGAPARADAAEVAAWLASHGAR